MYSSTHQIELVQTASRIFVRENANDLPYSKMVISGDELVDLLEPYGLPLGFVPITAFGQNISLVINKTAQEVQAFLNISKGDLSELRLAELARRLGFYAAYNSDGILLGLALNESYSDIVKRKERNVDNNAFLANLDMGDFSIERGGSLLANRASVDSSQFDTLTITGVENGRREKNEIITTETGKAVFQNPAGEASLSLTRGTLSVGDITTNTVAQFGTSGNFTSLTASAYDFAMTAGRSSFVGPIQWEVQGHLVTDKINFSIDILEIESFINATRGQDVFIDSDNLEYSTNSGIDAGTMYVSNITMRDQTSSALDDGKTGLVILDIRPAGTSILPDVSISTINNDMIKILAKPTEASSDTVDCKKIISDLEERYDKNSLAQYILCQYVYWERLEQRINIKKCLLEGKSDCI